MTESFDSIFAKQKADRLRKHIGVGKEELDDIQKLIKSLKDQEKKVIDDLTEWISELYALDDAAREEIDITQLKVEGASKENKFDGVRGPYAVGFSLPQALEAELKSGPPREPVHYAELWRRVEAKGYRSEAQTPANSARHSLMKRAKADWSPVFEEHKNHFALIDWYTEEELKKYGVEKDVMEDDGSVKRMTRTAEGIRAARQRGARWGGAPAFTPESWEWASNYWRNNPDLSDQKMADAMEELYKGVGKKKVSWNTFRKWKKLLLAGEPYYWPQWAEDHPDAIKYPAAKDWQGNNEKPSAEPVGPSRPTLIYDSEEGVAMRSTKEA